jgi:hypothetical protein
MGKFFKIIGSLIFCLIILSIVFWVFKNPIISSYLSKKMGMNVSIRGLSIGSNRISIDGVDIKNPKDGYKQENALEASMIEVQYKIDNLLSKNSSVDLISIDKFILRIECNGPVCIKNNWSDLLSRVPEKEEKAGEGVTINKLLIKDLYVTVQGVGLKTMKPQRLHISQVELNNINSKKGFPIQQIMLLIFKSAGLQNYLKTIFDKENMIKDFLPPYKNLGIDGENLEEGHHFRDALR